MSQFFTIQATGSLLIIGNIHTILVKENLANARFDKNTILPNNLGSLACRSLLQQVFFPCDKQGFLLAFDDSQFPYTLHLSDNYFLNNFPDKASQILQFLSVLNTNTLQNNGLYSENNKQSTPCFISFSHSQQQVAMLLSATPMLGVDIEDKIVSEAVSERYFLPIEIAWVESLPAIQQTMGRKLLWTLKESLIKAKGSIDSQLIAGLKVNIFEYLTFAQMRQLLGGDCINNVVISNNAINNSAMTKEVSPSFNIIKVHQHSSPHVFGFSPKQQCGFYQAVN